MNFVDKKDVAGTQVGENGRQVARALYRRAGGDFNVDAHLIGQDVRQSCFSQARRAVEQHVIQRFGALASSIDQYLQVFFDLFLADQIDQAMRAQRLIQPVIRPGIRVDKAIGLIHHISLRYPLVGKTR